MVRYSKVKDTNTLFVPQEFRFFSLCAVRPNVQTTSNRLKIDPAPGATIGGMISTGCSGST